MNWLPWTLGLALWVVVAGGPFWMASKTMVVDVGDTAPRFFQPDVARVKLGDTVVFSLNHDHGAGAAHTVTSVAGPAPFDSGVVHWAYKWTPTETGEYTYVCAVHPYMKGVLAVDRDPSVKQAVNGEGGVWPPNVTPRVGPPAVPGVGEIWLDLQWLAKPDKPKEPGAVVVIDAATWQIKQTLPFGNNPHNLTDSPDGRYIYQSSWHGNELGIYDRQEDRWAKVMPIGSAPAHIATVPDGRAYVTLNAENFIAVVDPNTFEVQKHIELRGKGPHGIWVDRSGRWIVAALTLSGEAAIIDTTTDEVVAELPVGRLPLAASINGAGTKAYIPSALDGTITVIDVPSRTVTKVLRDVGAGLIQVPFTPDDRYAVQAVTGSGEIVIIDGQTDQIIKRLPDHLGAHGVTFGLKQGGGWYAYVSHKFADVLTIVDMDTLTVAGEMKMPAPGGNGIHAIPNVSR
jgi:DNA-binding beta-propeller fold protein YncE/plastocyanin